MEGGNVGLKYMIEREGRTGEVESEVRGEEEGQAVESCVSALVTAGSREASLVLGAGEDAPETASKERLLQQLPVSTRRQLTQGVPFLTHEHHKHFALPLQRQHR